MNRTQIEALVRQMLEQAREDMGERIRKVEHDVERLTDAATDTVNAVEACDQETRAIRRVLARIATDLEAHVKRGTTEAHQ